MIALLILAMVVQEVPLLSGRDATLARMSDDMTAEVSDCGTKVTFVIPPKKDMDDAKGVIDAAATPEQVKCAKARVSWLITDAEARAKGVK